MNEFDYNLEEFDNSIEKIPQIELSEDQRNYMQELSITEKDWDSLSDKERNAHFNLLLERIDEITNGTNLSRNLVKETCLDIYMQKQLFLYENITLKEDIKNLPCERKGAICIGDGPINPEKYYDSPEKILFILKDPYDKAGTDLGGWDLAESLNNKTSLLEQSKEGLPTYRPMVAIANQLLEGKEFNSIDTNSEKSYEIFKSSSGYINIGKELIDSTYSSDARTSELAKQNKVLLEKQIEVYNPNIVIGGNTLKHLITEDKIGYTILGEKIPFENKRVLDDNRTIVYFNENKIFIDTYHPSRRENTISTEKYCNQIAETVKAWRNQTL